MFQFTITMKLREDQLRVQDLLKETITLLCKNGLSYKACFTIDALIGVTLDDSEVFLVNVKETVGCMKAPDSGSDTEIDQSTEETGKSGKGKRSRKRPPDRGGESGVSPTKRTRNSMDNDEDDYADDDDDAGFDDASNVSSIQPDSDARIKQEPGDDHDLVFVKQEQSDMLTSTPGNVTSSFSSVSGAQPHPMAVYGGHSQDSNLDASQDASWAQNQNSSGNFDPANLANISQSTSQGGSNQVGFMISILISKVVAQDNTK